MKRILVTGGSGYIGSVVVKRLIERGYEVVVFDNLERGHACNVPEGVNLVKWDLRDAVSIKEVMLTFRPDAVIHFAAYALVGESMRDPMMYFMNNVKGGINLLEAMVAAGCNRIIFSSSCATYGVPPALPIEEDMPQCPTNPYGYSKLVFEQMCGWLARCGVVSSQSLVVGNEPTTNNQQPTTRKPFEATFLRYFNAAGAALGMVEDHEPETHIIPNVLKVALGEKEYVEVFGTDYPTPDGTCIRDYVHLEDLCSAHILALEKGITGAFNLGTGKGVSVKEIIETCRKVTGREIPVKLSPRRAGDPPALYASGRKAREVLGWEPKHSDIETIVGDAWAALCDAKGRGRSGA